MWDAFATSSKFFKKLNWKCYGILHYFHSEGNVQLLREKVLSIPGHLTDTHSFPSNEIHKECSHGELRRMWLEKGSKVLIYIKMYICMYVYVYRHIGAHLHVKLKYAIQTVIGSQIIFKFINQLSSFNYQWCQEVEKVNAAIRGKNDGRLEDLQFMTGECKHEIFL